MSRSYRALLAAEGSDWFWWFGSDPESGHDFDFDTLFRAHLANAYRALGKVVPDWLSVAVVTRSARLVFRIRKATQRANDQPATAPPRVGKANGTPWA